MRTFVFFAATGVLLATAGVASAQTVGTETSRPVVRSNAPSKALELGVQMGWAQPFGGYQNVANTARVNDLVNAGGSIELDVGYRFDPHWLLSLYGSGSEFATGSADVAGSNVYSATAGVAGAYHFVPFGDWDPWLLVGSGWRGLWINSNGLGTDSSHGMDLARAEIGVDYRITPTVTIAPVIGATASMFFTHEAIFGNTFTNVSSPEVSTFLFGGLMGRFDVGGTEPRGARVVAKR